MKYAPALALMLALAAPTAVLAQAETEPTAHPVIPVVPTDVTPTQGAPNTPINEMIAPSTIAPATTVAPAITTPTAINTQSAQAFLNSLATKFGTNPKKLRSLLDKLPPRGKGLSTIEIAVISSKLKLTKEEKAILKARVGAGGTGFTREDAVGMGVRLGLSDADTERLAQQLGIVAPAYAGSTIVPASY